MTENPYEEERSAESSARPRHILVLANETVAGRTLLEALRTRAADRPIRVTVISPQNDSRAGYVVYEESRRSSAERRLRRTLDLLHEAGIAARGVVVDPDPLQALRDALHEHAPVDEVIISTHPGAVKSSWLRAGLVERARKVANVPVTHVEVDLSSPRERSHVIVLANQTMVGEPLLAAIRERAKSTPADFTLVAPADVEGVEKRLEVALARLGEAGVEASGHLGDPDPFVAVMNAVHDEGVDEIIISTLPRATSGWLRRDVIGRVKSAVKVPVRHIVVEPSEAEEAMSER